MDFIKRTNLGYSWKESMSWRWRTWLGRVLERFCQPAREMDRLLHMAYVHKARSPGSRLTDAEIEDLKKFMHDVQELATRRAYFQGRLIFETFQGLVIGLVAGVLEHDATVRSVLNIGTHYAHSDHHMACQWPHVQFTGVDFAPNLADFNKEFARANLRMVSGYALDMLESGDVRADVVIMSSTAVVIKNAEMRRYLRAAAKSARYIVLNEPIYILPGGAVIDPDKVALDESRPAHAIESFQSMPGPLCYVHNFRAMLAEAGLHVLHYHVFQPAFTNLRMVQAIAATSQAAATQPSPVKQAA
jgi:hypothetical protein